MTQSHVTLVHLSTKRAAPDDDGMCFLYRIITDAHVHPLISADPCNVEFVLCGDQVQIHGMFSVTYFIVLQHLCAMSLADVSGLV